MKYMGFIVLALRILDWTVIGIDYYISGISTSLQSAVVLHGHVSRTTLALERAFCVFTLKEQLEFGAVNWKTKKWL